MGVPRSSGNSSNERKKDLLCRVKYCNRLPDIPFDPKFLTYPFDPHRFVKYKHTSLEGNYKHELHTETDLGLDIDLISMDCEKEAEASTFNEVDEKLLEDEVVPVSEQSSRNQRRGFKASWLRRTEYISSEYRQFQNLGVGTENKVGVQARKHLQGKDLYKDRDSQITAIENTFETINETVPNRKNGVYPVEMCPVFPDFEHWKYPFSQVQFDTKPVPLGFDQKDMINLDEKMNNAMIRGMVDDEGHQFVVYFLPTNDTMGKLQRGEEIAQLEYKLAREYNWTVNKDESTKGYEEKYFIVWRDGHVYYNELGTRVKLAKRRYKGKKRNKIKLIVKPRELSEPELQQLEVRMKALEKPELDELEEEEGVEEEKAESDNEFGSPKLSPDIEKPEEEEKPVEEEKEKEEEVLSSDEVEDPEDEAKNIFGSDDDDDDL